MTLEKILLLEIIRNFFRNFFRNPNLDCFVDHLGETRLVTPETLNYRSV